MTTTSSYHASSSFLQPATFMLDPTREALKLAQCDPLFMLEKLLCGDDLFAEFTPQSQPTPSSASSFAASLSGPFDVAALDSCVDADLFTLGLPTPSTGFGSTSLAAPNPAWDLALDNDYSTFNLPLLSPTTDDTCFPLSHAMAQVPSLATVPMVAAPGSPASVVSSGSSSAAGSPLSASSPSNSSTAASSPASPASPVPSVGSRSDRASPILTISAPKAKKTVVSIKPKSVAVVPKSIAASAANSRSKRKYCRLRPDRSDFASEAEYETAFQAWRVHRDRNNKAVRKSRSLGAQRKEKEDEH